MIDLMHITSKNDWSKALQEGSYRADSLLTQGFIHCSTPAQVADTANRFYAGQQDLVLLGIDSQRVGAEVRWENLERGQMLFPHIYGPLNLEAVVKVIEYRPGEDGRFSRQVLD